MTKGSEHPGPSGILMHTLGGRPALHSLCFPKPAPHSQQGTAQHAAWRLSPTPPSITHTAPLLGILDR